MGRRRSKLFIKRYLIYSVFFIFSMVSYGFADIPVDSISGSALGDMFKSPDKSEPSESVDFDEFDEFDEFEEFNDQEELDIYDPLNGYNRFMTRVNDKILIWFFKPVTRGYRFIVREPVQSAVARFFNNISFPDRFVNNLLQIKVKRAGIEAARFCINSTLGFVGFFDPAKDCMGLDEYSEDFGQTLGYYGVGSGFHIVLPFLGPSNLRDTLGKFPDYFLDPLTYIDNKETRLTVNGINIVNAASLHIGQYELLKKDAVDLYILLRNGYEMKRQKQIEE